VAVQWIVMTFMVAMTSLLIFGLRGTRGRALLKLAVVGLTSVLIIGFASPELTATLASWLGVYSGTELLVYAIFLGWIGSTISLYRRIIAMQLQIVALSRHLALAESNSLVGVSDRDEIKTFHKDMPKDQNVD